MDWADNLYGLVAPRGSIDFDRPGQFAVMVQLLKPGLSTDSESGALPVKFCNVGAHAIGVGEVRPDELYDLSGPQSAVAFSLRWAHEQDLGQGLIRFVQSANEPLTAFIQMLSRLDRFEPSAWFERDRRHLQLTDRLTGRELFSLFDEAVDEAITDGFITPPRTPRPHDSDWRNTLVEYARQQGLIESLEPRPLAVRKLHQL